MAFSDEERDDLLMKALLNAIMAAEALLDQCGFLTKALERETPPSAEQIQEARRNLDRWRADLDMMKRLLAGLTIEPPQRPQ
jgi:hypothetical protein